jgi:hypothetical protein
LPKAQEGDPVETLREEAEYLRLCLGMGLLDNGAVVAWEDRNLIALKAPPVQLIDVSLARDLPPDELMRLLESVPGQADLAAVAHQVLAHLRERFDSGAVTIEKAVDMLWAYHNFACVLQDELWEAGNFPEYLYGVQEGWYGPLEALIDEFRKFSDRHATRPRFI